MRAIYGAVATCLFLVGCSQGGSSSNNSNAPTADAGPSPLDLLKAGDPHVCANPQVEDLLFTILKQHINGMGVDFSQDLSQPPYKDLLPRITMSAALVTSSHIDKDNQKISCNAQVTISAGGVPDQVVKSVDYDVTPELSTDGSIVVQANTSDSGRVLFDMLNNLKRYDEQNTAPPAANADDTPTEQAAPTDNAANSDQAQPVAADDQTNTM